NLAILARGLQRRLGALYTATMWRGTRRIALAALVAALVGTLLRYVQYRWFPTMHPRLAGIPVLGAFGATYLLVAWAMGSAEAARWLRRPVRRVGS
uniref:hypothetical protein n=1 Tax=Gemmatimonas sp. TaxID=1962908 RepID=UPI0035660FD3